MDKASIGGVLLAVIGILAGLLLEGGNLGQIFQPTAAMIVFGGTMGAVLLQFPLHTVVEDPGKHHVAQADLQVLRLEVRVPRPNRLRIVPQHPHHLCREALDVAHGRH